MVNAWTHRRCSLPSLNWSMNEWDTNFFGQNFGYISLSKIRSIRGHFEMDWCEMSSLYIRPTAWQAILEKGRDSVRKARLESFDFRRTCSLNSRCRNSVCSLIHSRPAYSQVYRLSSKPWLTSEPQSAPSYCWLSLRQGVWVGYSSNQG